MQAALCSSLNKHAVRILQGGRIKGSGFLLVPKEGYSAYILTAAHVFSESKDDISIQFLGIPDQNNNTRSIAKENIITHAAFDHSAFTDSVPYSDAALIKIAAERWMDEIAPAYWGIPEEGMPIQAVGFSAANCDPMLPHASASHQTVIRVYTPADHRISATIRGDFILNYADLDNDIAGMSGTVFAAQGQEVLVMIGMIVTTTGQIAAHGQLNLVDMTGIRELLEAQGVVLEQQTIRPIPTGDLSLDMDTEDFYANRHFVHRNTELECIKQTLQAHRHIVLSGMGGIGKTELARQYAEQHYGEYRVVHQINCAEGAAVGFSQVQIPGIERSSQNGIPESDESFGRRKINWLRMKSREYLLILDDLSPSDSDIKSVLSLPVDRIITSRWNRSSWNCQVLSIDALPTLAERISLFESYLEQELTTDEKTEFEAIDNLVEGHTLTLQLIALQCAVADTLLSTIRNALENQGVYTDDPNIFSYGDSLQERNAYGHIRTIWNLAVLQGRQCDIMQALSLLSPAYILRTECCEWLELSDMNDINHLIRSGWLQPQRIEGKNTIRTHMVIADIICHEQCSTFPDNISGMIDIICNKMVNRDLDIEERTRFIHLSEQLARRLPPSVDTIRFIQLLSMEEESIRQFVKGEQLLERSAQYLKDLQSESHILQVDNDSDMGVMLQGQGKLIDARSYFQKARIGYERFRDVHPVRYGVHLYNEARFLQDIGKFDDAFRLIRQAETICKEHAPHYLGKVYDAFANHYSYKAKSENTLARVARSPGAARRCHLNCLKYLRQEHDYWQLASDTKENENPLEIFDAMVSKSNLACVKAQLGDRSAISLIQSALEFYIRTAGECSEYVANTYDKMCMIYENLDEYKTSFEYGREAERIFIALYGPDTHHLITVYHNILFPLRELGDKGYIDYYTFHLRRLEAIYQ